jgi:Tol biopolymer transport system component
MLTPDGSELIYTSNITGTPQVCARAVEGGPARVLVGSADADFAQSLSHDGRYLLYVELGASNNDIWSYSMAEGAKTPFAVTQFDEVQPVFSPDGRHVAFSSNESGRYEVYVAQFPGGTGRVQISAEGGSQPSWRGDGRELYYVGPGGRLTAVPIETGPRVRVGSPSVVTTINLRPSRNTMREYDPSPDGKSFLVNSTGSAPRSAPFTVVTNWQETLPRQ